MKKYIFTYLLLAYGGSVTPLGSLNIHSRRRTPDSADDYGKYQRGSKTCFLVPLISFTLMPQQWKLMRRYTNVTSAPSLDARQLTTSSGSWTRICANTRE